jgi:hypothetical protein
MENILELETGEIKKEVNIEQIMLRIG